MPKQQKTVRDSVFRKTGTSEPVKQGIDTPDGQESTQKIQTGVWLSEKEIHWIDEQITIIKRQWRGVKRSALIRAVLTAVMEEGIDLSNVQTETEIVQRIKSALHPRD